MESEPEAPNKEPTTEENRAANDADASDGEEELSFQAAVGHWEEQQNSTKSITLPVRNSNGDAVGSVTWRYRMLTEEERREAEQAAISIEQSRNKEEINTDSGALKDKLIEHGVVDGPEGYENKRAHRGAIPDHQKEPLADAIDSFSEMPEEVREGF